MTAPAVGQLTPSDLAVGQRLILRPIGNNVHRGVEVEPEPAVVVKVGRKLVTAALLERRYPTEVVLRIEEQVENSDFAGWAFRTVEQDADDRRRTTARARLKAHGIEFTRDSFRGPADDRAVPVDLAEALADAADAWAERHGG